MIVRISSVGQYELDDDAVTTLDKLDTRLTEALHAGNESEFHAALHETISFVQRGKEVPHDQLVPSDVVIPPDDITLAEAKDFFTDEGLMAPLPA